MSEKICQKTANEIIEYIKNDAEISIPIEELMNPDGTHTSITKKQYGLVLIKYLCEELKEKFII